jgi:CO/xanthine dehydrogenase FAD-binding subunit
VLLSFAEDITALAACARNVADYEIRGQATVGGNLCSGGDLQGCLLALDAQARSAGSDGERTEPLEDFLGKRSDRLLLDISFERPAASAFVALEYPHTHEYTVLAVTAARAADGTTRIAATGGGTSARLRSAEVLVSDPAAAADAAPADVTFADDALASAWYRAQTLSVLVRRALTQLEESA